MYNSSSAANTSPWDIINNMNIMPIPTSPSTSHQQQQQQPQQQQQIPSTSTSTSINSPPISPVPRHSPTDDDGHDIHVTDGSDQSEEIFTIDDYLVHLTSLLIVMTEYRRAEQAANIVAASLSSYIASNSSSINYQYISQQRYHTLSLLTQQLQYEESLIQQQKQQIKQKKQTLLQQAELCYDRWIATLQHQQSLYQQITLYQQQQQQRYRRMTMKVIFRHRSMLDQLLCLYPILPVPHHHRDRENRDRGYQHHQHYEEYMIRGMRIPNHQVYQYDEEQISTGFSYIAHFLVILSMIYHFNYRYRIIYRSSRSSICDEIVSASMFPLYWKGVERERFEMAVLLLNKNIEQSKQRILTDRDKDRQIWTQITSYHTGQQNKHKPMIPTATSQSSSSSSSSSSSTPSPNLNPNQATNQASISSMSHHPHAAHAHHSKSKDNKAGRSGHGTLDNLKELLDLLIADSYR